jgi:hypothetical protein
VYCSLQEAENGGLDNFHIDHFRPKSRFNPLRDTMANLLLSCAICNRFKSDDWPGEPAADHSVPAYIDPATTNYNEVLTVDQSNYRVAAASVAGRYMVERLYLNRPQMIRHWRSRFIARRIGEMEDYASEVLTLAQTADSPELGKLAMKIAGETIQIGKAFRKACELPPYLYGEIKRPTKSRAKKVKPGGSKPRTKP